MGNSEGTGDGTRLGKLHNLAWGFKKGIKLGIYVGEVLVTKPGATDGFKLVGKEVPDMVSSDSSFSGFNDGSP